MQSMKERVPWNDVPERRSDFWQKGTERDNYKGTERGTERRSRFWWNERNGNNLALF